MSNSSEAISMLAQAIDVRAGDNVVINTLESPSGILPWLAQKANQVEIRVVHDRAWQVSIDDMTDRVDERTRLVMTSLVSYLSDQRIDYRAQYQRLESTPTLLLLDVTQALGAIAVDIQAADFVVCSSYNWLLSTHGVGILGINPHRTDALVPQFDDLLLTRCLRHNWEVHTRATFLMDQPTAFVQHVALARGARPLAGNDGS